MKVLLAEEKLENTTGMRGTSFKVLGFIEVIRRLYQKIGAIWLSVLVSSARSGGTLSYINF